MEREATLCADGDRPLEERLHSAQTVTPLRYTQGGIYTTVTPCSTHREAYTPLLTHPEVYPYVHLSHPEVYPYVHLPHPEVYPGVHHTHPELYPVVHHTTP